MFLSRTYVMALFYCFILVFNVFASAKSRPNVLLLVADDLGWGDLSLTGHPTISTPHIDHLAREGSLFTQFIVGAPICTPSRAAMLTGRLPQRSGIYADLDWPLDDFFRVFYPSSVHCLGEGETTLGDALKPSYSTAMIGKWHVGHNPEFNCLPGSGRQGFDFFFGLPYSHEEGYPGPFPEGLVFPPVPLFLNDKIVEQPFNASDLTSRYTDLTELLVRRYAAGQNSRDTGAEVHRLEKTLHDAQLSDTVELAGAQDFSKPFFLHLAYENPHVPLFTSDDYSVTHKPSLRGLYGDAVSEMDSSIGRLLRALEEEDISSNTLVIFLSDNGAWVQPNAGLTPRPTKGISPFDGGSNAPFRGGKGSTWEGGMRVPLIVRAPHFRTTPQPDFVRALSWAMDLFPTVLDFAGIAIPRGLKLDGSSLRRLIAAETSENEGREPLHECIYYWREKSLYAIRCGALKAHFVTRAGFNSSDGGTTHEPPLLFNVEWDPAESLPLNPLQYVTELAHLVSRAKIHSEEVYASKPPSLYVPQNFSVMPCCSHGNDAANSNTLKELADRATETFSRVSHYGGWQNLQLDPLWERVWSNCICQRP